MKNILGLMMILLAVPPAMAGIRDIGNGGDICEDHFKIVRDDIIQWLQSSGADGLRLPSSVSISQYSQQMLTALESAKITCTDSKIYVDGSEKTCKNSVSFSGAQQIVCNNRRFMGTPEEDLYVLVHHEYAGLAGFEINKGSESNYSISNQLTGFLTDETVKRLAVKAAPPKPVPGRGTSCEPTASQWQQASDQMMNLLQAIVVPKLNAKGIHVVRVESGKVLMDPSTTGRYRPGHIQFSQIRFVTADGTGLKLWLDSETYDATTIKMEGRVLQKDLEGYFTVCGIETSYSVDIVSVQNEVTSVDVADFISHGSGQTVTKANQVLFRYPAH